MTPRMMGEPHDRNIPSEAEEQQKRMTRARKRTPADEVTGQESFRVVCLGRGNIGQTFATAWRLAGMSVQARDGRATFGKPKAADAIVIAVPDRAIEEVAKAIAARGKPPCPVLHTAGSRGLEPLAVLRSLGVPVGVMHPMISAPVPLAPRDLDGACMVLFGDEAAMRAGSCLAVGAGMRPVRVRKLEPARYHLGASLLANGAAALAWRAEGLLVEAGVDRAKASEMLSVLLMSVARNISRVGAARALSGPVRRGDMRTVQQHLDLIRQGDQATRQVYEALTALQLSLVGTAPVGSATPADSTHLEDLVLQHLLAADAR